MNGSGHRAGRSEPDLASRRVADGPWRALAGDSASVGSFRALMEMSIGDLSAAEVVDAIVASEKAMSAVAVAQMRLLTEFARPNRAGDVSGLVATLIDKGGLAHRPDGTLDLDIVDSIVEDKSESLAAAEVGAALRISPITAGARVRKAKDLCRNLPGTVEALASGKIDRGRALMIAERTAVLSPELRASVEERILPLAPDRSAGNLRPLVDRAVIAVDPEAAEARERKAKRERELTLLPLPDGMASLKAFAPAAAAISIFTLADLLAGRTDGTDTRPVGARRVDALADIADELLTYGRLDLTGLLDDIDDDQAHASTSDTPDTPDVAGEPARADHSPDPTSEHPGGDGTDEVSAAVANNRTSQNRTACDTAPVDDEPVADPGEPAVLNAVAGTDAAGSGAADPVACGAGVTGSGAADPAPPGTIAPEWRGSDADAVEAASLSSGANDVAAADAAARRHPSLGLTGAGHRADCPFVRVDRPSGRIESWCRCVESNSVDGDSRATRRRTAARWKTRQGRRSHLAITMSASTWAGLDRLPAHLDGYGAVTAATGLMLARSAGSINAVVVDPISGTVIDVGERVYRPRQAVRDAATTLAETCRFPSCRQPAGRCDLDHRDAFDHEHPENGGGTTEDNLDPLCRRHHLLKHHSGWRSVAISDHGREWSSPTNHHYVDPPRSLTLPGELLTPTGSPRGATGRGSAAEIPGRENPVSHGHAADGFSGPADADAHADADFDELDDFDGFHRSEGRDWREAEFGGAFPDTVRLKVLNATALRRIQPLRHKADAQRRVPGFSDTQVAADTDFAPKVYLRSELGPTGEPRLRFDFGSARLGRPEVLSRTTTIPTAPHSDEPPF